MLTPLLPLLLALPTQEAPVEIGGVYPGLAMYNDEGECGVGAVVPWAGKIWAVTYAPHRPHGSTDRLWSVDPSFAIEDHPESIGGTPACRMIHKETNQLLVGPYVIDARGRVRVIPYERMPGRLTGVARHLGEPERKVYYATMEEGLYEVDLLTLEVTELFADDQGQIAGSPEGGRRVAGLPGYHDKGLASGQGRVVYANNGEPGRAALEHPDVPSGCLAEWNGTTWRVVRRAQFTEVTGPGTLHGSAPEDPIWAIGWDHRSLILMVLAEGHWSSYRLPKASHSYDGAHGWNTEWPRIRDVGEESLLMTMHGTFWSFPRDLGVESVRGIRPRSTYLKVVGDFARVGERIVLGCDDVARNEFLNVHAAAARLAGPGQSHSNLWFVEPQRLDALGPNLGRGALWLGEDVDTGTFSEPYLFAGYERRCLWLVHHSEGERTFRVEVDRTGEGTFERLREEVLLPGELRLVEFPPEEKGEWLRIVVPRAARWVTASLQYRGGDDRSVEPDGIFAGLARLGESGTVRGGWIRARGEDLRNLALVARDQVDPDRVDGETVEEQGFYELGDTLALERSEDPRALEWHRQRLGIGEGVWTRDEASVLHVDETGARWRLPIGLPGAEGPRTPGRALREVVTERNLFHAGNTFYELPARNAGGFGLLRPIATHPFAIEDFAGYRGLLILTGIAGEGPRIVESGDGRAALWAGVIDELWQLGRPRGSGGPWFEEEVQAGVPSDPYLMTGYDEKHVFVRVHRAAQPFELELQLDLSGQGDWHTWRTIELSPDQTWGETLPEGCAAYWIRGVASRSTQLTLWLEYR